MAKKSSSKKQQWNTEAATNLILLYENHPCLYRVKSKDYHNRNLRNKAYSNITESLNTLYPDIAFNEAIVKNKIHTLRTQYNSETNKIKKSESSGVSPDDVYVPKLWCYDLLGFLEDAEVIIRGESNLDIDADETQLEDDSEVIFDGTIEDIRKPFSPSDSLGEEQNKRRPSSASCSSGSTLKRPRSSQSEETPIYKKRETPVCTKRKQEDSQLSKLLDNATKAISSIGQKPEENIQDCDINLFTSYLAKEMKKIKDDEILDNLKENVMHQLMTAKRIYREKEFSASKQVFNIHLVFLCSEYVIFII